jgi:hypothetical protein
VELPHLAKPGRGDKHPILTQRATGSLLAEGGILEGKLHYRLIDVLRDLFAKIGTPTSGFPQGLGIPFAVEGPQPGHFLPE